ncbi:MAG TPA: hypothetical protein VEJ87_11610 [Acidimicrobiales bacterium]|nr:hypothetical protein [Acidimicrobiales bacterium]
MSNSTIKIRMSPVAAILLAFASIAAVLSSDSASAAPAGASPTPFLARFNTVTKGVSTVPGNGDVNPYGTVVVPNSLGNLVAGDTLVSNFNDSSNLQGTGSTIVQIAPGGGRVLFAKISPPALPAACPGGVGLTTALTVLPGGWVVVGSLPTSNGHPQTAMAGCLFVLNDTGHVVETLSGSDINGPWDLASTASATSAQLFVTNVLNGTVAAEGPHPTKQPGKVVDEGTIVRIDLTLEPGGLPQLTSETVVADGFAERTDPAALVVGPTGVALADDGTLYVADTVNNRIAEVPDATTRNSTFHNGGKTLTANGAINGPLGMTLAPNGDVLTVNGGNGDIVETTPVGKQIDSTLLDASGSPPGSGALFGLALAPGNHGVEFVDDATNNLDLLH